MIMKFWKMVFGGCDHKWKIIDQVRVTEADTFADEVLTYTRYHLQCEHCGDLKVRDMK